MVVSVRDQSPKPAGDGREGLRAQLHAMWSGVAGAWESNVAFIDARGAHVTQRMLALTRPQAGERVLELGCGPGGPGLDAARLVAPHGEVVLSDVAAEMTSVAAARASSPTSPRVSLTSSGSKSPTTPTTSSCAERG